MKRSITTMTALGMVVLFLFSATSLARTSSAQEMIVSRFAVVDGVKLHYLTAGHGPTVILIHGYTQTSRMWRPIIPMLAEKFTVIAPDLPGIGDSEIPKDGLDMLGPNCTCRSWRSVARKQMATCWANR